MAASDIQILRLRISWRHWIRAQSGLEVAEVATRQTVAGSSARLCFSRIVTDGIENAFIAQALWERRLFGMRHRHRFVNQDRDKMTPTPFGCLIA